VNLTPTEITLAALAAVQLFFLVVTCLRYRKQVSAKTSEIVDLHGDLDAMDKAIHDAETRLKTASNDLHTLKGRLDKSEAQLTAQRAITKTLERNLEYAEAQEQKAVKERDFARKTSTRQTAKMDKILEAIDPSGTLASEVSQGQ
jgi:chromosome segregation ATPase